MMNNIFIIIVILTLVVYASITYAIQVRMKSTKREYFVLVLISVLLFQLGYFFEMLATTTDGAFIAVKIMYTGGAFISTFYLMFVGRYCEVKLASALKACIFAVPVFIILLVWTSDRHTLYYTSMQIERAGSINYLAITGGIFYPLSFLHPVFCIVLCCVIIIRKMLMHNGAAARGGQQVKYLLLIFNSFVPTIYHLLYATNLNFHGVHFAPIFLASSVILIYFGIFKYDLLENEDAVRTQNWLREMVGHISHEMKTPLTVIATDIQLAEKFIDNGNISGAKELMREAWLQTMQTANLVTDSLSFSRSREVLKPMARFNSGAIIDTTLIIFEPLFKKHGNVIVRDIIKPAPMYGNADMLSVALVNLLSNANRHTNGGVINVGWTACGEYYRLTVQDNGSGISADILPRVFERGVSGGKSTGLGLAIVKNVAELHGGKVSIESEAGKGTTVKLTFPKRMEEDK